MIFDVKLASLVRYLDNVWPLKMVYLIFVTENLDPWETIGNQKCLIVIILERERGGEGEGGRGKEGERGRRGRGKAKERGQRERA